MLLISPKTGGGISSGDFVPYTGSTSNVDLGNYSLKGTTGSFSSSFSAMGPATFSSNATVTAKLSVTSSFDVMGSSFPVSKVTRLTGATVTGILSAQMIKLKSTGSITDGYGVGEIYAIEDSAGVENYIGILGFERDGADNSGKLFFDTYSAGVRSTAMTIGSDLTATFFGNVDFSSGIEVTGTIAGSSNCTIAGYLQITSGLSASTGTFSSGLQANNLVITSGMTATTGNFSSGIEVLGETKTANIQITSAGGVTSGYYLMANDATGNAVWAAVSAGVGWSIYQSFIY